MTSMGDIVQFPNRSEHLRALWQQVLDRHLQPEDEMEVAALLESFGWSDARAQRAFGVQDVFELADLLRSSQDQEVDSVANEYLAPDPWKVVAKETLRQFVRGIIFALPMTLSIAAMLWLRFSLWSYQYLSTRAATAIAAGTILSFLTVGGFMQAMARQGYFYMFQGHYRMMQRMTYRFIVMGVLVSAAISFALIVLDTLFPELPPDMLFTAIAYYMVLNSIWLAVAVLYIIQREFVFTGLLAVGILLVFIGFRLLHANILAAQLISMLIVAVLSLLLLNHFFRRDQREKDRGINPPLPRIGVTLYSIAPYFLYGLLYFALLFCDRVMAWSTHSNLEPFVIWFRGDYELGLDFALTTLILPMGMSEIIVARLMGRMWRSQRNLAAEDVQALNHSFVRQYAGQTVRMAILSAGSAAGVYVLTEWLLRAYLARLPGHVQLNQVGQYVFAVALMSYTVLAVGLLHAVVMFSLSRPELVLRPILMAVGVNFALGFLLTRWIGYAQAIWGLFAGCAFFTVMVSRNVRSVLLNLDYHMYLLS
ncbi:MAG: hypothetical protein K6T30_01545 [Alicyclobacillus sp.]|nr:hypothetical protein [Alicyclobacillus sp.]